MVGARLVFSSGEEDEDAILRFLTCVSVLHSERIGYVCGCSMVEASSSLSESLYALTDESRASFQLIPLRKSFSVMDKCSSLYW